MCLLLRYTLYATTCEIPINVLMIQRPFSFIRKQDSFIFGNLAQNKYIGTKDNEEGIFIRYYMYVHRYLRTLMGAIHIIVGK